MEDRVIGEGYLEKRFVQVYIRLVLIQDLSGVQSLFLGFGLGSRDILHSLSMHLCTTQTLTSTGKISLLVYQFFLLSEWVLVLLYFSLQVFWTCRMYHKYACRLIARTVWFSSLYFFWTQSVFSGRGININLFNTDRIFELRAASSADAARWMEVMSSVFSFFRCGPDYVTRYCSCSPSPERRVARPLDNPRANRASGRLTLQPLCASSCLQRATFRRMCLQQSCFFPNCRRPGAPGSSDKCRVVLSRCLC